MPLNPLSLDVGQFEWFHVTDPTFIKNDDQQTTIAIADDRNFLRYHQLLENDDLSKRYQANLARCESLQPSDHLRHIQAFPAAPISTL